MTKLAPDDPRHGTYNGYGNLGCRCDACRKANTAYYASKQTNLNIGQGTNGGEAFVTVPIAFHDRFKAYAKNRGRSMRSLALEAITKMMDEDG